jgi:hypothetical protein
MTRILFVILHGPECFSGHFYGHADQAVRCRAHRPVRQVSRDTLDATGRRDRASIRPVRIVPADAMVIDFGIKNRVVALWKSLLASIKKARKHDDLSSIKSACRVVCREENERTRNRLCVSQINNTLSSPKKRTQNIQGFRVRFVMAPLHCPHKTPGTKGFSKI